MTPHVLILGGTGEARRLATRLGGLGVRVTSSLAGRVAELRMPPGEVRVGGFGGADGLADWMRRERVDALVDATHPFAETMTANAVRAGASTSTPMVVLRRAPWLPGPGDDWRPVDSLADAAALVGEIGERVFLTTGRQGLHHFAGLHRPWFLVRAVDPPEPPLPDRVTTVLARGPFTVDDELAVLRQHRIDVVVTKNSGGSMTGAKLAAARELDVPVVMVQRPPVPDVSTVDSVDAAAEWVNRMLRTSHAG